jgi:hypothetical protein
MISFKDEFKNTNNVSVTYSSNPAKDVRHRIRRMKMILRKFKTPPILLVKYTILGL